MTRILVVDDKEMMRDSVATTLARRGFAVVTASSGAIALEKLGERSVDAVVTDLQMPEMDGLGLLDELRKVDDQLPVIFMTAYGTIETAVAAMKQGAYDYITKPFSGDELLVAVERAVERRALQRENQILRATVRAAAPAGDAGGSSHPMVGSGRTMTELRDRLQRVADSHGTVLISGESGTGKEVTARWIHEHSPRADQPFLAINCAALSRSLLESELFGHEKGAFTGADKLRKGRFELADGGTLLLDEISEIPPAVQAKLLRVLQERCFERVGSSRSQSVDVRVIATTNRDLPTEVMAGSFREDLYYRLNVLPVALPPLRSRREDVPELAEHFLSLVAQREGRAVKLIEPDAMERFLRYDWPGNVRELQNLCERAAVLTRDDAIRLSLIESWLQRSDRRATPMVADGAGMPGSTVELKPSATANDLDVPGIVCDGTVTLEDIEREAIIATLERNNGHRQKSARALGIGVRTLGLKLKKWKELELVSQSL